MTSEVAIPTAEGARSIPAPASRTAARLAHFGLVRSEDDRIFVGLAGGFGTRWGIDPTIIRMALAVLATAAGAGVVIYLIGCVASVEAPRMADVQTRPMRRGPRPVIAVALIVAGLLVLLRGAGVWFGDGLVWPVAVAALGTTLIWARGDGAESSPIHRMAARMSGNPVEAAFGRASRTRIALGAVLVIAGAGAFLSANRALAAASILVPILVTAVGLGLVLGPWLWKLARQLSDERRERIRSEERAEVAAHLHDSVLQTLALIQRSESAREMATLARVQERELRSWLYGKASAANDGVSVTIDQMAGRVEELHQVVVEAIVVGDAPIDDHLRALVLACGEATMNAARHSGADSISVYVEVEDESVTAFVRDQGKGFDPDTIPSDRRGIRESIHARMERHGGWAEIFSAPGDGTEVQLRMPRRSN
ncbi:MAG TPA: PspC domain-containing protein [Actinomycetota bacterium]|nr:PspC domain-containing protein [Actinomycetota bacterium]